MAQKQFNRFGLRRDLNLSDLPSPTAALNNILSTPTMLGGETSFTTEDLVPIQRIYITNITASTFSSLDGVTVAFTIVENGIINNSLNPKVYLPLIKIKNRLDAAYFSTGEPFFFGGDGPNARYYDNINIVRDAPTYSLTTDLTGGYPFGSIVAWSGGLYRRVATENNNINPDQSSDWKYLQPYVDLYFDDEIDTDGNITTLTDNFWERGQFTYSEKLQSSFLSLFGGTNWQGFYKPTVSGTTTFLLNTTGSTIFKFQDPTSQSFEFARYGSSSSNYFDFFNGNPDISELPFVQSQIDEILAIYNDPTRQLVRVKLQNPMKLKHGDLIFLDVDEGQVPSQRYRILTEIDYNLPNSSELIEFFIEVTEEFNKLNLDVSTLEPAYFGWINDYTTGEYINYGTQFLFQGLKATVRYTPYDRKNLKTYLNSYRHRIDIPLGGTNAITGATTFTVTDEVYQNLMINDYIYDYRLSTGDTNQGVRRYIITACSSSNGVNTITVEIDTSYDNVDTSNNNDQQYYYRIEGTQLTGNYSTVTSSVGTKLTLANGSNTGVFNWTRTTSTGTVTSGSHNYGSIGTPFNYYEPRSYYEITPSTTMTFDFVIRGGDGAGSNAGEGATITGTVTLQANTTYTLVTGGNGASTRYAPQFGGGGAAGKNNGGGGGGFSGLFLGNINDLSQISALVIAAGGGGSGSNGSPGGNGGEPNGGSGGSGTGATQTSAGTTTWVSGGLTSEYEAGPLQGGDGELTNGSNIANGGGGGGGGYYGGGGGRGDNNLSPGPSGGGGGSSYINATSITSYTIQSQNEVDNTKITTTYVTGGLNRSLSTANSYNTLLHVARMGELTTRQRYITIEQYLDRYVDYAFDWTFFMKDEDVDPTSTNKAWILRQRTETSGGYGTVSYKYLYEKDYEFYQIGDFKTFLDNSILSGGTSREDGVDQRAYGKPQLINKGDQYNLLYSVLPIKSIYSPEENWNGVALSRTGSISNDSRLLSLNNATDVEIGNYVIQNNNNAFTSGDYIEYGTRIIDVLPESNSVVLNKQASQAFSNQSLWILNHRGFICTGILNYNSGEHFLSLDSRRIEDVKAGQVIVFRDSPSTQTYVRITKVEPSAASELKITLDDKNPYPTSSGGPIAIYNDKGIDITKPLQTYCTGIQCAQNNYQGEGKVNTKYIAVRVFNGSPSPSPGLDRWWTETLKTGTSSNSCRAVFTPTANYINQPYSNWGDGPSVAWWTDADTGFSYPNQSIRVGSVDNPSGRKYYGGAQFYANIAGSELAKQINEKLGPGNTFRFNELIPIGICEGFIRVDGDLWNNSPSSGSEKYYAILRLVTDLSSVPQPDNGYNPNWQDGTLSSDGSTLLPIKLNLSEFPSSAFNITKWGVPPDQGNMLPYGGTVASASNIQSVFTNYNNSIIANSDRQWTATTDITLTQSQAQSWFLNSTSLAQDDGNGNITYVMKAGTWFKTYSTTGYLLYFDTFESIIDTETFFTYRPTTLSIDDASFVNDPELINLYSNEGPTSITSNDWINDQFQYMQYRNESYQILPTPLDIEARFPGIRMIDPNVTTSGVRTNLQNTTNALSVYTFGNTTLNRELCCPPLDTSPPFDSSEIGLSTTNLNPDLFIDGLINVRSISAIHPENKIYGIPSNINNAQLPVNEKLEVVFGGVKYDLLIGNSKPF